MSMERVIKCVQAKTYPLGLLEVDDWHLSSKWLKKWDVDHVLHNVSKGLTITKPFLQLPTLGYNDS